MGKIVFNKQTGLPDTPGTGSAIAYVDVNGALKVRDDDGTIHTWAQTDVANVWTAPNEFQEATTFNGVMDLNGALDAELQGINDSHTFRGAAGQVAPVTRTDGNADVRGNQYYFANPSVVLLGASNIGSGNSVAPRMAMVHLEMDYDGANDVSISPDILIYGGGIEPRDLRQVSVLIAHIAYRGVEAFQARWTIYAPYAFTPGGTYQSLTVVTSQVTNTGYNWTAEIQSTSSGVLRVRTTRTSGMTSAAKIQVSLLIAA